MHFFAFLTLLLLILFAFLLPFIYKISNVFGATKIKNVFGVFYSFIRDKKWQMSFKG
ncbi:hypothetical protein HCCG_00417 [Helicobacter cinaedi CCUG 18818 = ATCC BAA-847]|uniref:Uncharacterized protein n=1 Tax=Helicobacter cinaedi CCUG 18818 = ATCC BAA-847 TaxID=537971 RepID=A0ABN0B8V1_9HELI|nr:hypothetical protein HCCG_00417 [Helicobacter cinaedi CCUG 18818 = ATCC BAA-847]